MRRIRLLSTFGLLLASVLLAACQSQDAVDGYPTPDPAGLAPEAVEPRLPSPTPAIHTALWWDEGIAQRDMDLVVAMEGFEWIKQKFAWRDIEGVKKNDYDWYRADRIVEDAEERGLNLLVRLDRQPFWAQADGGAIPLENAPPEDFQDFEDFCFAVADRYRGRIQAYQVWNEPNLAREWGNQPPDPIAYARLLGHCARGIRNADPDALVISAGLAPTGTNSAEAMPHDEFLRRLYQTRVTSYFDILGVNAPGYAAPPETPPEEAAVTAEYGGHRWNAFRHVEDIRRIMVENGDADKQIAILEMGWTTDPINEDYSWFAVTEAQQADYLVRAYEYARAHWQPWISIMTTIYIPDPSWTEADEEYWWAIVWHAEPDPILRPAYEALSTLPDWNE